MGSPAHKRRHGSVAGRPREAGWPRSLRGSTWQSRNVCMVLLPGYECWDTFRASCPRAGSPLLVLPRLHCSPIPLPCSGRVPLLSQTRTIDPRSSQLSAWLDSPSLVLTTVIDPAAGVNAHRVSGGVSARATPRRRSDRAARATTARSPARSPTPCRRSAWRASRAGPRQRRAGTRETRRGTARRCGRARSRRGAGTRRRRSASSCHRECDGRQRDQPESWLGQRPEHEMHHRMSGTDPRIPLVAVGDERRRVVRCAMDVPRVLAQPFFCSSPACRGSGVGDRRSSLASAILLP